MNDVERVVSGEGVVAREATRGGTFPSNGSIDHAMIARVIEEFEKD